MDAVLTFQQSVGVFTFDGHHGGLDARLVAFLVVQRFPRKAMALRPAGIHPVEHLAPVLRLGAAGAGVELENHIIGIVFAGEQCGHPGLLHAFLQRGKLRFDLLQRLGVLRLLSHFAQGGEVLPCAGELAEAVYLILKLLQPGLNLLGAL